MHIWSERSWFCEERPYLILIHTAVLAAFEWGVSSIDTYMDTHPRIVVRFMFAKVFNFRPGWFRCWPSWGTGPSSDRQRQLLRKPYARHWTAQIWQRRAPREDSEIRKLALPIFAHFAQRGRGLEARGSALSDMAVIELHRSVEFARAKEKVFLYFVDSTCCIYLGYSWFEDGTKASTCQSIQHIQQIESISIFNMFYFLMRTIKPRYASFLGRTWRKRCLDSIELMDDAHPSHFPGWRSLRHYSHFSTAGFRNGVFENTNFMRKENPRIFEVPDFGINLEAILSQAPDFQNFVASGELQAARTVVLEAAAEGAELLEIGSVLDLLLMITVTVMSLYFEVELFVWWQCIFKIILLYNSKLTPMNSILMYWCSDRRMRPNQDPFKGSLAFWYQELAQMDYLQTPGKAEFSDSGWQRIQ